MDKEHEGLGAVALLHVVHLQPGEVDVSVGGGEIMLKSSAQSTVSTVPNKLRS